jgi:hypothetical protein
VLRQILCHDLQDLCRKSTKETVLKRIEDVCLTESRIEGTEVIESSFQGGFSGLYINQAQIPRRETLRASSTGRKLESYGTIPMPSKQDIMSAYTPCQCRFAEDC